MTNTERLIAGLNHALGHGISHVDFMVGRYTGNGSSVVAALRRRGYAVNRVPAGSAAMYRLTLSAKSAGGAA
jgi:hypothetical protein